MHSSVRILRAKLCYYFFLLMNDQFLFFFSFFTSSVPFLAFYSSSPFQLACRLRLGQFTAHMMPSFCFFARFISDISFVHVVGSATGMNASDLHLTPMGEDVFENRCDRVRNGTKFGFFRGASRVDDTFAGRPTSELRQRNYGKRGLAQSSWFR